MSKCPGCSRFDEKLDFEFKGVKLCSWCYKIRSLRGTEEAPKCWRCKGELTEYDWDRLNECYDCDRKAREAAIYYSMHDEDYDMDY